MAVIRFARAYGEAYKFMANPANRDEVVRITTETTDASADIAREVQQLHVLILPQLDAGGASVVAVGIGLLRGVGLPAPDSLPPTSHDPRPCHIGRWS